MNEVQVKSMQLRREIEMQKSLVKPGGRDSQWDHRLKVKGTHRHTYIDHSVLGAP